MALTPFDMEGVNRDLLAAGNPAKPDMQSILRRNARDLVLGNAILVSSADAKELEFGVHMAYSDADGGFDTDPSEDVWFEASSLPIPNERPDLPEPFSGKTVSLCDQLEQATKQTAAEVEEMRRQEPSVESSDGNDDSTAFFQDFLEGKKIVGLSM